MAQIHEIDGKYYDYDPTNNPSFLQTAAELKELGIKNYYFMLEIKNPKVLEINPFNPKITREQIAICLEEAKNNFWYFCRSLVRIMTDAGTRHFELHRGLCAALWCFTKRFDWCLCEPRQTWKTSGTLATIISWAFQLSQNLNIHFFGKDQENTKRNLGIMRDCISVLPGWLQFRSYVDDSGRVKKTRQSMEILENQLMHNKIVIHSKANNESAASQMARGASAAILYFDEIEHTPFFDIILANSAPAFMTASSNAKSIGQPYGRCMSTTPGNLDTREGLTTLPIIKSMITWSEKLYDMTDEEISDYKSTFIDKYNADITKDHNREALDVFYIEYKYYQIRKDDAWVNEQLKKGGDRATVRREILLERLRGSKDSPISPDDIEYLIQNIKQSTDLIIFNKWRLLVYDHGVKTIPGSIKKLFDEKIPYIIGIDPASGGGADNTAITIINPNTLQIAAEFKNPYIVSTDLEELIIELVKKYMPNAVIIPERNSMGVFLIQHLCKSPVRNNLYWSDTNKQLEKMAEEDPDSFDLKLQSNANKKYGTYLTKKIRDAMLELLFKHINECKELLTGQYLVDDICKLVRTSTGRIEAASGEHDDSLFSYLHAIYLYYTGDNLELFGIDTNIMNPLESKYSHYEDDDYDENGFFSTKDVSYDEICINQIIEHEENTKFLMSKFDFYTDPYYENLRKHKGLDDYETRIPPSFFDLINDV